MGDWGISNKLLLLAPFESVCMYVCVMLHLLKVRVYTMCVACWVWACAYQLAQRTVPNNEGLFL